MGRKVRSTCIKNGEVSWKQLETYFEYAGYQDWEANQITLY